MDFSFTVLSSGSRGNVSLLRTPSVRLLIDAGLNGRQLQARLEVLGVALEEIDAVVLTHEHGDHTAGLPALLKTRRCRIYSNLRTWQETGLAGGDRWEEWATGDTCRIGDVELRSFPVPHDAGEPVGLRLAAGGRELAVVTDLGFAPRAVVEAVRGCAVLALEANYDPELLRADVKRPWPVKQRIANRHGHLSNAAAAALAAEVASERLGDVFLCHLSEDCNRPELAEAAVGAALREKGWEAVRLHRTGFESVSATVAW